MAFPDVWPYISWNINICKLSTLCSGDILVKGYRLHLLLEKKMHANAKDDCLEMRLVDTELDMKGPLSFKVSVYLKDANGKNHFLQKTVVESMGTEPIKLIWKVTLFDLFENSSLNWKTNLELVCMFGPESDYPRDITENTCDSGISCSGNVRLQKLSLDLSRMLSHSSTGDVILRCDKDTIKVHKCILSIRSKVFKKLLEDDTSCEFPTEINITDVDCASLTHLVIFLYSGKVLFHRQTVDSAMQLYEASLKYEVAGLTEECRKFLLDNLEKDSACRLLLFASEKKDEVLLSSVTSFIIKNEILRSEVWAEFSFEYPELAIKTYFSYLENYLSRRSYLASIN